MSRKSKTDCTGTVHTIIFADTITSNKSQEYSTKSDPNNSAVVG